MKKFFYSSVFIFLFNASLFSATAQEYVENGIKFFNEEKYFDAIGEFRNAIELNPYYARAYEYLGKVYFRLQDYSTALEQGLTGLKYSNNDLEILLLVAECYRELNDNNKAEELYKKIIKDFPSESKALISIAEYYLRNNKLSLAYDYLAKADRIDRDSYKVAIALGNYNFKKGDFQKSEYYYKKAFNLNPYDRYVFVTLANFYVNTGRLNDAVTILESGRKLFENFYTGTSLLSECYLSLGKTNPEYYNKAVKELEWLIENNKKLDDKSLANLCYKLALATETIDKEKSIKSYNKAIELNPENELFRYSFEEFVIGNVDVDSSLRENLAKFHLKRGMEIKSEGDLELYLFHLKRAVTLSPFLISARMELLNFYEARGDNYNVYEELKKISKIDDSYVIKDKIEKYEWRLKKEGDFDRVEYLPYRGVFFVDSDYYNFDRVFQKIFSYYSQYTGKFKFSTIEFRKNQGIREVLKHLSDNNENFFVVARLENKDLLEFQLFDKTGKLIESRFFNFKTDNVVSYIAKFYDWLNNKYPSVWKLGKQIDAESYKLNAGSIEGIKEGEELATFDILNMQIVPKGKVIVTKLKPCSSIVNIKIEKEKVKKVNEVGAYALKSEFITEKYLTKWKRVLGY
ncbi:MAG: tetratricopeptide repeat protein [Brevinematia bacterium]